MFYSFTSEDADLLGTVSGRDPLGILPVWQHRARDVVPHLTAASGELAGFHLLLVALAWWPTFAKRYTVPTSKIDSYFILVEQAFARACNTVDGQWPLPGTRRLSSVAGVQISLDQKFHLLHGQLANGTWGIYRGPAIRSGLIDENNNVTGEIEADIVRQTGFMQCLLPDIFNAMEGKVVFIAVRRTHQLVQELSAFIKDYPLVGLLKKFLLNPSQTTVTKSVVTLMRKQVKDDFDIEPFLQQAMTAIPKHSAVFRNIVGCERYLATVEAAFEWLCSAETASVKEASIKLPIDLSDLRNSQKNFSDSGNYGANTLVANYKKCLEKLDSSSKEKFIQTLVQWHGDVSRTRGNDPLLSIQETGLLDVRVQLVKPDESQLDSNTSWRNAYYLPTLFNLVRQFDTVRLQK